MQFRALSTSTYLLLSMACGVPLACAEDVGSEDSPLSTDNNSSGDDPHGPSGDGDNNHDGDNNSDDDNNGRDRPSAASDCQNLRVCGAAPAQSCCEKVAIAGGDFLMGTGSGADVCPDGIQCGDHESPEHEATVSPFFLNTFEVTVGRFRQFVELFNSLSFKPGEGAHALIIGSGIDVESIATLPADEASLRTSLACDDNATFTESPGNNEDKPINCVSWPLAVAFCLFDGGRLPTEAEWEFAAAGGAENRLYPWGNQAPDESRASFFPGSIAAVGSHATGKSLDGVHDMAGNLWEWVFDWLDTGWYEGEGALCVDCARVSSGTHRVLRGGAFSYKAVTLRSAARSGEQPEVHDGAIGFRCAYDADDDQN